MVSWRARHKKLEALLFFMGGFCFDLLLLERIDSVPMLIHQGSYLALLSLLLAVDHHYTVWPHAGAGLFAKLLSFRHEVIHFLFGTLLNAFLVFYFKAASGLWAFAFMLVLVAVLVANELPRFRALGPSMRVALLGFALASYFAYLFPVLAGFLSPYLFVAAVGLASAVLWGLWALSRRFTGDSTWSFSRAVVPGLLVQGLLLCLYFLHVVPPVPLSLRWLGIYHGAQREGAAVRVKHENSPWRFWEHGDETFYARPGDRIYCFTRIFAPRHFRDELKIRWTWKSPLSGWIRTDAIPLTITGGGEAGWRGIAYKQNYAPGEWQVAIETADGRDIGHIGFTVIADEGKGERAFVEELR